MNKKLLFALLGFFALLVLANFYFMNQRINEADASLPVSEPPGAKPSAATTTNRHPAQKPSMSTSSKPRQAPTRSTDRQQPASTGANWQKPEYIPTEEEQARAAILATMTPEEQREAQKDLYKLSMFYRSPEQVDKAIEAARKKGNSQVVKKLERFRRLAYPND